MNNSEQTEKLLNIVKKLRSPEGCPWDRRQTSESMLPCLLDEVYEFFEAVDEGNREMVKEELGDILMQVVFHSQLAHERGDFSYRDVVETISEKLIRRHPHVFSSNKASDEKEILRNWEDIKRKEKGKEKRKYLTDGIPEALPALFKAEKFQKRLARSGFDWDNIPSVLDKVEEEFKEFREAVENNDQVNAEEELGDIMFALVNVARHKDISAEDALRKTIDKFKKRVNHIEDRLNNSGKRFEETDLEVLDSYWEEAKSELE